jgi:hypothetical protein
MQTCVVWYKDEETWEQLRQASSDQDVWENSYEQWLENASSTVDAMEKRGVYVKKVSFGAGGFVRWCDANDKPCDGKARSQYAVFVAEVGEYV